MTRVFRMAVAGVLVAVGAAAAAPSGGASAAVAPAINHTQLGCTPDAGTVEPDGSLNHVAFDSANLTAKPWRDFISNLGAVSALGSTTYDYVGANTFRTITVRAGYLRLDTTRYPNADPSKRTFTSKVLGHGWGAVTKIVDASDRGSSYSKSGYLYALAPQNGTLGRYKVREATYGSPTVASAGSSTGFGAFRSLTLAYRYREGTSVAADVLIGTTSAGRLALVTIPVAGTFAPRVTTMRASTWTFDDVIVSRCQSQDHFALLAVRRSTQRAYLYRIDSFTGTSSVIRSYGAISGAWPSVRSSAYWLGGTYPSRW